MKVVLVDCRCFRSFAFLGDARPSSLCPCHLCRLMMWLSHSNSRSPSHRNRTRCLSGRLLPYAVNACSACVAWAQPSTLWNLASSATAAFRCRALTRTCMHPGRQGRLSCSCRRRLPRERFRLLHCAVLMVSSPHTVSSSPTASKALWEHAQNTCIRKTIGPVVGGRDKN